MGKLFLEVVTPEKVVVSEEVDIVVAPGSLGEFGVLEGHLPFLSGILPGELHYSHGEKVQRLAVTTGFAEVSKDRVSVLVDAAERADEIDLDRARSALQRAKERLAKDRDSEDIDYARAEAALKRAVARIKIAEREH
jgi:F-type H+-transporting ATPase subunit epsilon